MAAVLAGDMKTAAAGGVRAAVELAKVTHAGMTMDEFSKIVKDCPSGFAAARRLLNASRRQLIYRGSRRFKSDMLGANNEHLLAVRSRECVKSFLASSEASGN